MSSQSAKFSAYRDLMRRTPAEVAVYHFVNSLWQLCGSSLSAALQRRHLRNVENDLMAMPDYLLKDIGIARSEVSSAVNGHLERYRTSF